MCLMKQNAVLIYIYYTVMRRIIKYKKNNMIFICLYEESEKNPVHLVSAEK